MSELQIKKLRNNATIPTRGSKEAAGLDLYAATDYTIEVPPGETVKVGTGIAIALPENTFGGIYARSGLATKQGLRPSNCTGVVDQDYRGEVVVALYNDSSEIRYIKPAERIAQLIIQEYIPVEIEEVEELDKTERGDGGFGSTGN